MCPAYKSVAVHLPGSETRCWVFVRVCTVERLSSRNLRWQSRHGRGEAGTVHPASTRCFCPLFSGFSEAVVFGKTPKAKGRPEARFKDEGQKPDKSRASQVTPGWSQRPAVRAAFRAFTDRGRDSRNCLEDLAGVRFWGHFRGGNYALVSVFPGALLSQRFEKGSIAAPGRLGA